MRLAFILCLLALTGWSQPVQRNPVTTNLLGNAAGSLTNDGTGVIGWSLITGGGQTNWPLSAITNALNLTNWALLSTNSFTNVIVAAGSNVYVTPSLSGQVRTYTVDVPTNAFPAQRTQWAVSDVTNAGTAAYSNAAAFLTPAQVGTIAYSNAQNYILSLNGNGTNITLYGSSGGTNFTYTSTNGWWNTNTTATNQGVNIVRGEVIADSNVVVTSGQFIGNGAGLTNLSVSVGSSNITDSGYIAVIRNANVQTNLNASNLTVTNPATFHNGLTNAQGTPNALAVYGANTNLIGLANPQNIGGWVLYNGTSPAFLLPKDYSFVIDDFLWVSTPGGSTSYPQVPWEFLFSGTGANNLAGVSTSGHPGTRDFITGTTTSGYSMAFFGGSGQNNLPIVLGGGVFFGEWIVYIPVAASAGDPYWLKCAVSDNSQFSGGAVDNNFVGFTCTTNTSGDFIGTVRAASGTTYTVDSKLAAVGGNWYRLGYLVSADGSSTKFYTNGVLCGTISQAAPTAKLTPAFNVIKTAGTTSVTNTLDLYWHIQLLTTGR